jgi:hypothetical protein
MPVAGLLLGAGQGLVRRRGEPNDPLGGTEVSAELDGVLSRRRGRGEPLPASISQPMGEAMGADLDAVRIHTGDEPAQLARSLQAQAFTRGVDIYFGAGSYAPHTPAGQRLLAHELAHTVQQGPGGGSGAGPIIGRAADPAEAEADRVADSVMQVLRRKAIRRPDPADSVAAAGDRASIGLDPLRRAQQSGAIAGPGPVRSDRARPLDRLRRLTRTDSSPDVTTAAPAQQGNANPWQHLRHPTRQQNPATGTGTTAAAGPGARGRRAPIRRFYAVVHEPREGVEYKRVGKVPYVWLNDADFKENDWVVSDVVTGWSVYKLYQWSALKIAAEIERKAAEAAVLKQQQEAAAAAQQKLEDDAAEAKRQREEADAEAERKQQELIAEETRKREQAEAAEAQRLAARLEEEKRVTEERVRVAEEKQRKAAEREAAEKAAAAQRAEEKKRQAAEREAADKAAAKKKAEEKKQRAIEQEAADKKAAIARAEAKAEAQRLAAAREAAKQEKARQEAVEKKAAEEKAAAEREVAERLRIEQERLAAEAATAAALLLAAAKEKEKEERLRAEEAALAEARAKKAAKDEADRLKREAKAKAKKEARAKAEAEARAKAEEQARADAEAKAKAEAEERARIEAEEKARAEAKVKAEAEAAAKAEAAEKAKAAVTGPSPVAEGSEAVGAVVDPVVPVPLGADYDPLAFGADQKFGNEPFSFDITTEDPAVKAHLAGLFAGLKAETSKAKNTKLTDLFAQPHFAVHKSATTEEQKKARTQAVKGPYPKLIRHGPIDKRLAAAPAFAAKYELRAEADKKTKSIIDKSTGESVGVLLIGIADAFANAAAQPGRRQGMTKKHKLSEDATHVVDSAGVPTRRFAYFETSRQQLMDGLGPSGMGALRGRYPRFREAMGLPSTLNQIDRNDASVAQMYGGVGVVGPDGTVTVSQDVMAHTHQYLGNGLNQRGISLASTPKKQVFSNDGDPFKSDDGVRIKVDLSLVPEDVILFNHYAEGGVGSRLAKNPAFPKGMLDTKDKDGDSGRAYAYANSVVKNRELLLEKLKPEWIVELTDHLKDSLAGSGGPTKPLAGPGDAKGLNVDQLKAAVGFDAYERGRADVKAGKKKDTTLTGFDEKNYNLGWSTGNEEVLGANAAVKDCSDFWIGFTAQPLPPEVPVAKSKRQMLREKEAKKSRPAPDVSTAHAFGALSAEKITDRAERLRLQTSKPAWYVLAQLRFVKIGDKLFRPTMHDSFWLAWAAKMKTPPTPVVAASTVPREGAGVEDPVLTT